PVIGEASLLWKMVVAEIPGRPAGLDLSDGPRPDDERGEPQQPGRDGELGLHAERQHGGGRRRGRQQQPGGKYSDAGGARLYAEFGGTTGLYGREGGIGARATDYVVFGI